jgi:hypothetical protein
MALPTSLMVEAIEELPEDQVGMIDTSAREAVRGGRRAFRLKMQPEDGLVVAGALVSAEDELESYEPSPLPCWPMRSASAVH